MRALTTEIKAKALARLTDAATKPMLVTSMIEDGVSSLVPLETKLNKHYELVFYRIDRDAPLHRLHEAYEMVQKALVPLPVKDIEERITMLCALITLAKDFSPKVLDMKRKALASKLAEYPADIVIDAFGYIERNVRFFPTLAEFINEAGVGWKPKPRFMLRDELQKCIDYQEAV